MLRRNSPLDSPSKNICGTRIRQLREKRGKSLIVLAAELDVDFGVKLDRSVIGKIESGRRKVSDYELFVIAEALGVSVQKLFPTDSLEALKTLKRGNKDES